jgi:hypothetical protein
MLPVISQSLPICDGICRRFLNFARVYVLITIRLWYDSSRYVEFTMLKLFRFLVAMYGYVRRDLSVLSIF